MENLIAEALKVSPAIVAMFYIIWAQNKRAESRDKWTESLYVSLQASIDELTKAIRAQQK